MLYIIRITDQDLPGR